MHIKITLIIVLLLLCAPELDAGGWEWQLSLGTWTLQPLASPVERLTARVVSEEVREMLTPLLGDFTVLSYEPKIDMRSQGVSFSAGVWRQLAAGRFAVGLSASYLNFALPFSLKDVQNIYFQGIHVATVTTSGEGSIDLRTFMLGAQGRWRVFQRGRATAYTSLGLALLRFSGDLHLPLTARVDSILGSAELSRSEDMTLDKLREESDDIPAWSMAPALGAALHYRLGKSSRLFIEINLSQGTFLSTGVALDL